MKRNFSRLLKRATRYFSRCPKLVGFCEKAINILLIMWESFDPRYYLFCRLCVSSTLDRQWDRRSWISTWRRSHLNISERDSLKSMLKRLPFNYLDWVNSVPYRQNSYLLVWIFAWFPLSLLLSAKTQPITFEDLMIWWVCWSYHKGVS